MGTVRNGEVEIQFDEHGSGDRGTVVLICGTGQPAAMWAALGTVDALMGAGYRVVTFDNRGMVGAACPTPPWTVADMADDALAVLDAVGPAHIAGASLGALIAQNVALRHPEQVRSVTLLVGGGQFSAGWAPLMSGLVELHELGNGLPPALDRFMMLQAMLTPQQRHDPALVGFALEMAGGLTDTFGPGGKHGQHSASATWIGEDHVSELAGMVPPVLVIAHEHDPCFALDDLRAVAAAVPNGTFVEMFGVSHVALDPTVLSQESAHMLEFLASA
jgi:pimeloyl-ACP methyl ester carboxylesterase